METEEIVKDAGKACATCRWFIARGEGDLRDYTFADCNCFHSPYYGILDKEDGPPDGCDMHWPGQPWMEWWVEKYPGGSATGAKPRLMHCVSECRHYDHVLYPCQAKGPCCWPGLAMPFHREKWAENPNQ